MSLQNGYTCSLINTVITSYNFVSYYKILKIILCCTLIFGTILVMLFFYFDVLTAAHLAMIYHFL